MSNADQQSTNDIPTPEDRAVELIAGGDGDPRDAVLEPTSPQVGKRDPGLMVVDDPHAAQPEPEPSVRRTLGDLAKAIDAGAAPPPAPPKPEIQVTVGLSPNAAAVADVLVKLGLFGATREAVLEGFIMSGLRQAMLDFEIRSKPPAPAERPRVVPAGIVPPPRRRG